MAVERFFDRVDHGKPHPQVGPEPNDFSSVKQRETNAIGADECAVFRPEILDVEATVARARDARVAFAHSGIFDNEIRAGRSADDHFRSLDDDESARACTREQRQRRSRDPRRAWIGIVGAIKTARLRLGRAVRSVVETLRSIVHCLVLFDLKSTDRARAAVRTRIRARDDVRPASQPRAR